jgi:CRP/FNR family cyclic AMP-dependent transcriptional regulator
VLITLTQVAPAEMAGASRATVNQVLREEERRGTIELQRGKALVLDTEELKRRSR